MGCKRRPAKSNRNRTPIADEKSFKFATGDTHNGIGSSCFGAKIAQSLLDHRAVPAVLIAHDDEARIGPTPVLHSSYKLFLKILLALENQKVEFDFGGHYCWQKSREKVLGGWFL